MTKKQQQTITVAVLAGMVLLAVAYFFAIKPQLSQRADNQSQTDLAVQKAQMLNSELGGLEAKKKALPDAERAVAKMTEKFPNDYQQDDWLMMVNRAATKAGVNLSSLAPTEPISPGTDPAAQQPPSSTTGEEPTGTTPQATAPTAVAEDALVAQSVVTISASGSTQGLAKFVASLEDMERPLLIDSVQFASDTETSTVTVVGKTFLSRGLDAPEESQGTDTP